MDELRSSSFGGENPIRLSNATLLDLPAEIARPRYDRGSLTAGIVHIGLGNFHRAHQAWYSHRLMQEGKALDWAIVGAGVRENDRLQRRRLAAQDWLSTLIELDPAGKSAEVTGSMIGFLPVETDNQMLVQQMAEISIRIVSLTVTEGGYFKDPATGDFDAKHPDIQHDVATPKHPRTAFGAIVAALSRRRARGMPGFTCLSCDNLRGNGQALRATVVSLAEMIDPALASWIDAECGFPNSMVDCIVPATSTSELDLVQAFGVVDAAPVTHEPFRQWVLEDDFRAGRPPWEDVGATFTGQVNDYEEMKIRILNGGHQVIAATADLLGVRTIAQAMEHKLLRALLRKVALEEIVPNIAPTPDMTPRSYFNLIERRFSNPEIADTARRVAFDGSSRHPAFVLPSIQDCLISGTKVVGLALISALWSRYCEGVREDGSLIEPNDPNWSLLQSTASMARVEPAAWLGMKRVYGDLGKHVSFATTFAHWRSQISNQGVERTLRAYLV
ncbi:MAG: mannitol dehydrogenase family protein [Pseudomonadota bacterium]